MFSERHDVFAPCRERRQVDHHARDALIQISPKLASVDPSPNVLLHGAHDAKVNSQLHPSAKRLDLPGLEHAKQFPLCLRDETSKLVEKQSAPARPLYVPDSRFGRARERPASMSEQQALDHVSREGTTVHVDEQSRTAAPLVDVLGKELLARTGRADQEDWNTGPSVPLRERHRPSNGR